KKLISIERNITTTSIPHLSIGLIIAFLSLLTYPIFEILSDEIDSTVGKIFIRLIPILILVLVYLIYLGLSIYRHNNAYEVQGFFKKVKLYTNKAFEHISKVYHNDSIDT